MHIYQWTVSYFNKLSETIDNRKFTKNVENSYFPVWLSSCILWKKPKEKLSKLMWMENEECEIWNLAYTLRNWFELCFWQQTWVNYRNVCCKMVSSNQNYSCFDAQKRFSKFHDSVLTNKQFLMKLNFKVLSPIWNKFTRCWRSFHMNFSSSLAFQVNNYFSAFSLSKSFFDIFKVKSRC